MLQTSSTFWKLIEERRSEPTMSMKELRTRLKKRKKQIPHFDVSRIPRNVVRTVFVFRVRDRP